jgi:mercuric ion transport protein
MNSQTATKSSPVSSLIAGLLAALGATACCFGPLLLVSIGLGGAWVSSLRALEAYQPVFAVLTLAFIGLAFHRLYIQPRRCAPGEVCAMPAVLKRQRIVFWIVIAIIAAMFAFPLYAPLFY